MAEFTFTNSEGKPFTLKGPDGLTREQAEAIFKKQDSSGSLVGFKPGDVLSAATQAAAGLPAAQGALQQAQNNIVGDLGKVGGVASIGSISRSLGAAGGALGGSLAATAAGLTAAVGPAVSAASGVVFPSPGAAGLGQPLVSASGIQGATAITSIQTINRVITNFPISSPINTADFTKIASGITGSGAVNRIGPMSVPEVNGVLAQAENLVAQPADVISIDKGLGKFGLGVKQLETAGYLKPGTSSWTDAVSSTAASVLKSPGAWTGKDGIKSSTDLLNNPGKQSLIQQDLMAKGVAGLGAVGVPVQNLSSQGIAGMALNAAKDLPSAEAFVKGLPIPGDATGALQAEFSSAVRDGAFAVNLVQTKIPTAFKQEDTPVPSSNTVNRATVDAASTRVIGDDKVPTPNYGPKQTIENQADGEAYVIKSVELINKYINVAGRALEVVKTKIEALANQQFITQQQYDAVNNEFQTASQAYNPQGPVLASEVFAIYDRLSASQKQVVNSFQSNSPSKIASLVQYIVEQFRQIKELLYQLSLKIEGQRAGE